MRRSPISTVIVDDEPLARQVIRDLLAGRRDITIVAECRDGNEAVTAIRSLSPALVFLDIQMPGPGGFDVLRCLPPDPVPAVVFVTAYDEFAVEAFETEALDYLVKPFTDARFRLALDRALRVVESGESRALMSRALAAARSDAASSPLERILATSGPRSVVIPMETVDWIAADDYYARLYVAGRTHLVRWPLDDLERRLDPARFVRTHRSAIVNIARVRELRRRGSRHEIVLTDGTVVPVSERRHAAVAARLGRTSPAR